MAALSARCRTPITRHRRFAARWIDCDLLRILCTPPPLGDDASHMMGTSDVFAGQLPRPHVLLLGSLRPAQSVHKGCSPNTCAFSQPPTRRGQKYTGEDKTTRLSAWQPFSHHQNSLRSACRPVERIDGSPPGNNRLKNRRRDPRQTFFVLTVILGTNLPMTPRRSACVQKGTFTNIVCDQQSMSKRLRTVT